MLAGQEAIARVGPRPAASLAAPLAGVVVPACCSRSRVFFLLGFALYSLIYAAAGSLVSRPEDLQIVALPLSLIAIAGYLMGRSRPSPAAITGFIRLASLRPVLEPVRDADPAARSGGCRRGSSASRWRSSWRRSSVTRVVAIRIYSAGVLLYGQRPGLRAFVAAARTPR